MSDSVRQRDALYLFACHLAWHKKQNVAAYEELLAALDDSNENIRIVAEVLLQRSSPRPTVARNSVNAS
jgi:hypothetical protein